MASVRLKQLAMEVQAALPSAEEAMQHAEKWLACRDQHEDLLAAVNEVLHALRDELSMERSAKADYSRGEDREALTEVGVDLLMSLFRTEYRTPQRQTPQAPPFGRVLVVVVRPGLRPGQLPEKAGVAGGYEALDSDQPSDQADQDGWATGTP